MDTIKTHCYVTYDSKEVVRFYEYYCTSRYCVSFLYSRRCIAMPQAIKTRDRINGKKWPPESGIALGVAFSEETAMEVTTNGESKRPSLKRKASTELEATAHTAAASHPRQSMRTQFHPFLPIGCSKAALITYRRSLSTLCL